MNTRKISISNVDPAIVQDNKVLALSVNRQEVDRSVRFIREYGLLTPPVVGLLHDGVCRLLAGEREFMALRELGVRKTDAVMVPVETQEEMDRLSLLLSTLRQAPNPLSEGMLVQQILETGRYTQAQVGELLGKSVSWVNKRLSLSTRLAPAVRTMVTEKMLCAHSAQSIAKLPEQIQSQFAQKTLFDGLSKSAVELLVAAYNRPDCPESLRGHIVQMPRHALTVLSDNKVIKKQEREDQPQCLRSLHNNLTLLLSCIRDAERGLAQDDGEPVTVLRRLLSLCKDRCFLFATLLAAKLTVAPGKSAESEVAAHGH
jgi:ParB-like chromosome segregation protein Spo0J